MLIDLHCHILPGVDDGATSEEVALQMLKQAASSGIRAIAATSHNQMDIPEYRKIFDPWREKAKALGVDLYIGTEYDCGRLMEAKRQEPSFPLLTLNDSHYLLLDFASPLLPPNWENALIGDDLSHQLRLVIAHPERLFEDPVKICHTLCMTGAIIQVNAGSILGKYGPHARKTAYQLLDAGLCRIVAGDVHHARRPVWLLAEAAEALKHTYGAERTELLTCTNPQLILNNEPTVPVPPRSNWFQRIFGKR